ncbi:MAG: hypothetical protein XXXJIFNMEKO3_02031 [Candidatus Erwinia impunctatus]
MEVNSNENEQIDAVKRFFVHNAKALVIGAVIGIGLLAGWRFWVHHQTGASKEASLQFEQVVKSLNSGEKSALAAGEKFTQATPGVYGALASLNLAKRYVDDNQLDKALIQLNNGLKDTQDSNLQTLINLRIARLQLQMKKPDDALKTLENVKGEGWIAVVADIRGDALLSKGDNQGARSAWSKGIDSDASPALVEMLKMKMNNLPG